MQHGPPATDGCSVRIVIGKYKTNRLLPVIIWRQTVLVGADM
jgi:hypothetical protein